MDVRPISFSFIENTDEYSTSKDMRLSRSLAEMLSSTPSTIDSNILRRSSSWLADDTSLLFSHTSTCSKSATTVPAARCTDSAVVLNKRTGTSTTRGGRRTRATFTPGDGWLLLVVHRSHPKCCLLYTSPSPRDGL